MTESTEWAKDLAAVAFEVADLVQRVRAVTRAARHLADDAPSDLAQIVSNGAFNLGAAIVLIESGADALLAADDVNTVPDEDEPTVDGPHLVDLGTTVIEAGPRFSRPGLVSLRPGEDPADRWPR